MKNIKKYAKLIAMRHIVSINQLIFRHINKKYVDDHIDIKAYVQDLTDYYANYFVKYTKLKK